MLFGQKLSSVVATALHHGAVMVVQHDDGMKDLDGKVALTMDLEKSDAQVEGLWTHIEALMKQPREYESRIQSTYLTSMRYG